MPRRVLEGEVVSDKMDKTITVLVQRRYMHPVYKKYVMQTDKYAAHDEKGHFKVGDKVSIIECAPISKKKRWTVLVEGQIATPSTTKKKSKGVSATPAKKDVKKTEKAPAKPAPKASAKKTATKKKEA